MYVELIIEKDKIEWSICKVLGNTKSSSGNQENAFHRVVLMTFSI